MTKWGVKKKVFGGLHFLGDYKLLISKFPTKLKLEFISIAMLSRLLYGCEALTLVRSKLSN